MLQYLWRRRRSSRAGARRCWGRQPSLPPSSSGSAEKNSHFPSSGLFPGAAARSHLLCLHAYMRVCGFQRKWSKRPYLRSLSKSRTKAANVTFTASRATISESLNLRHQWVLSENCICLCFHWVYIVFWWTLNRGNSYIFSNWRNKKQTQLEVSLNLHIQYQTGKWYLYISGDGLSSLGLADLTLIQEVVPNWFRNHNFINFKGTIHVVRGIRSIVHFTHPNAI